MDIRAERIDRKVQHISDQEHNDEHDRSRDGASSHASHGVKYLRDDTCCKSQRQKPGIGQDVAQPARDAVQRVQRSNGARKAIQTISYAPYFLSNVVLVCIISVLFSSTGVVNSILTSMGMKIQNFTSEAQYFRPLYIGSSIWQSMGFNAIIYIAALSSISPELYEAALIDGANKFQRVWYIDLPLIMPTVILMFILAVGNIMTIGYEKAWLMQAGGNTSVSEIISTYVYKTGLQSAQYSFATAVGLFNSVVNFIILVIANLIAKKTADISIF